MARPLRIDFPGALHHVMSRGNDRQAIVRDDADRQRRVDWIRRTVESYGWRLHAFAVMSNHDHLFVETPEANLGPGMQFLNGSYTSYFNRRHRRVGHLFQGRFRSHLVDEEGYFLEVSRYIHLNPIRAGLVERPEDWFWSSYRGYHRKQHALDWVCYSAVLGEFGTDVANRRAYARFVQAGIGEPVRSPFADAVAGLLVGSAAFLERMKKLLAKRPPDRAMPQLKTLRRRPSLAKIAAVVAAHFGSDPTHWTVGRRSDDISRAVAAYLGRHFGHSAGEVAKALGYRSHGSVRNALARVESAGREIQNTLTKLETKCH
jgi:REP element-mobilizing transposase RayT